MLALAPIMANQQGIPWAEMGSYCSNGIGLLLGNAGAHASAIRQWIPSVYIAWNLLFNVVALVGLRVAGAATMTLFMTAAVPMAIFGFTFDLPLVGKAPPLAPRCAVPCF